MGITAEAPRGGVVDQIDSVTYTFILRNREIERFEDKHRGIFELWNGFFDEGTRPSSREVRDIVALALVGGGLSDIKADKLVEDAGPSGLMQFYQLAQSIVGVAFMPDVFESDEVKKKMDEDELPNVLTSEE
jgi:hypothetical protein